MNESRREAYLDLINQLLNCPSGEEATILDTNSELVDTGLVQKMEEVAEYIAVEGNQNGSEFLYSLANILSDMVTQDDSQNQAYCSFIDALFSTPSEEFVELLKEHKHLIDDDLVVLLLEEAAFQESEGYEEAGNALRGIASQFNGVFNTDLPTSREEKVDCFLLWIKLYETINTNRDKKAAFQLLEANSDKLNDEFAAQINCWVEIIFPDLTLEEVEATINVLLGINNWLLELPIGNKDINLEIAIASYESLLTFVKPDTLPETWATLKNDVGFAYYRRIKGEKSDNLAKAIDCYQLGLQVCSPDDDPQFWGKLQANLGNAYLDSNNLEAAVTAFQASLQFYPSTEYPENWAGTHNRLGLIYVNLQQYEAAITAQNIALNIFNRDNYPEGWGATHYYLGEAYYKRIDGEKLDNLEAAIEHYLAALRVCTKEKFAVDWANIQNSLGYVYYERIAGKKSENLEQARSYYLASLEVYTRTDLPTQWAITQFELGRLYFDRIQGIRSDNLNAAIPCFEAALQVFTRETFPEFWGGIQMSLNFAYAELHGERPESVELVLNSCLTALETISRVNSPVLWAGNHQILGTSYLYRVGGEKAENIEAAIRHLSSALEVYTRQYFPSEWAKGQKLLGDAYFERIRGEKSENIETAIQYYLTALEVHTREAFTDNWASLQNSLGSAYCNRIEGKRADNLETAINYYRTALQVYTRHTSPNDWAMTQGNLATAYTMRIRGEKADNLEAVISYYQAVLTVYTREVFPERWATTQQQLGNAYTKRIRGEKVDNLEEAIRCMEAALEVRIREIFPEDWAATQTNLANAYNLRIRGEKADNLETAISYSEAALQVYTRESFPEQWAGVHNNLSAVYIERIRGERAENLEQAIRHIQQALQVHTRESFPEQWAMLQTNLGFAYTHRIRGVRVSNLLASIRNYTNASQVYTRDGNLEKRATTQLNLSGSYFELVRIGENKANNAEQGIRYLQNALEVYTREAFPERWAILQANLSSGYLWLSTIQLQPQAGKDYLESAVSHSHAALQIFTREKFPEKWATIQQQLGTLHLIPIPYGIEEDKWKEELQIAMRYFQASLQIHTKQAFLQNYVQSEFSLATAYKYNREFHKSYEAFATAIDGVEKLRLEITSGDEIKQKLAEQWHVFYQHMVEVCLEIGATEPEFYQKAIEYVERSKARNLVELLYKRDLKPKGDISPTIINKLKQLQRRIVAEQRRLQIEEQKHNNDVFFVSNRTYLNQLLNQSDELISQEIDPIDPTFKATQKVNPIPFEEIQQLLDNRTAIIQWYIGFTGLETFIITRHNLQRLILPTPADTLKALEDWERAYREGYNTSQNQWIIKELADRLEPLAEILHIDEILAMVPAECKRLILIPHRYLHLFPLHALPLADGDFLCDRFPDGVGYSPSCQLLQLAQETGRNRHQFTRLFAIQNPTRTKSDNKHLAGTKFQVESVYQNFAPYPNSIILREQEATATATLNMEQVRSAHCVHFCCHGSFNFASPLESALHLAESEDKLGANADLTLGEIFAKLSLEQCRLVIFSACETGITDPKSISDEYIGLPGGFLYAGSPSIISTLWSVDQAATNLFMIELYKNLKQFPQLDAGTVAIAVNKTQKWLRTLTSENLLQIIDSPEVKKFSNNLPKENNDKFKLFISSLKGAANKTGCPYSNPYYWAGFVATGF